MALGFLLRGDVQHRANETDRLAVREKSIARCRDPSFDAVLNADGSVFNVVSCRKIRYQRSGDGIVRPLSVVWMQTF